MRGLPFSISMAHWPDRRPAILENAIEIDRRSSLSPDETMARYLAGEGRPVVVTDAQAPWKAPRLWSLDYFKKHYASEPLIASDRAPLRSEDNPRMQTLRTTLGDFIDYMQQPHHFMAAQERDGPFYGNSWSPFIEHEKLRGHISRPYFVPDDIPTGEESPEHARLDRSFTKVFLGPAGTVTRLHNDTYHTHAWLSQVSGTKQFVLYPPSQAHTIHAGEGIASSQVTQPASACHDGHCGPLMDSRVRRICGWQLGLARARRWPRPPTRSPDPLAASAQIDSPRCRTGSAQTWLDPLAPDYDRFPRAVKATP